MSLQKSNWKVSVILTAVVACLAMAWVIYAATTDFTANGPITIGPVQGIGVTPELLIMGGSAQSWSYQEGAEYPFKVTNPDSAASFIVGSADPAVKSFRIYNSSDVLVLCLPNTIPGSSFAALPTVSDTYGVVPANTYCPTRVSAPRVSPRSPATSDPKSPTATPPATKSAR